MGIDSCRKYKLNLGSIMDKAVTIRIDFFTHINKTLNIHWL